MKDYHPIYNCFTFRQIALILMQSSGERVPGISSFKRMLHIYNNYDQMTREDVLNLAVLHKITQCKN